MTDIHEAETGARFIAADDMIVRWLREVPGRRFEPDTFAWVMAQMGGRDGCFVDVGVATGWFSIPLLMLGRDVVGFECNARVMARLQANCELNGVTDHPDAGRGVFYLAAASSFAGQARFTYNPTLPLTSGGSIEPGVTANTASELVQVVTLDDRVPDTVAVMKIDAEGHEMNVLAGAVETIARERPPLVLEANTPAHVERLAAWCDKNGYGFEMADARNMLCVPRS